MAEIESDDVINYDFIMISLKSQEESWVHRWLPHRRLIQLVQRWFSLLNILLRKRHTTGLFICLHSEVLIINERGGQGICSCLVNQLISCCFLVVASSGSYNYDEMGTR